MRIYISGPMRGRTDYKERFEEAAAAIRAEGHNYINPAYLAEMIDGKTDDWYLAFDEYLITLCDAICFLAGSENSVGVKRERKWARENGLAVYDIKTGTFTVEVQDD